MGWFYVLNCALGTKRRTTWRRAYRQSEGHPASVAVLSSKKERRGPHPCQDFNCPGLAQPT